MRGGWAWLVTAWRSPGHQRNTALAVGKSTLAATLAWWVSHDLIGATSPAFAPFSAVLIMNATVHSSVWQALRYTVAVAAGVAVQAALGFLIGPELFVFALVAVIALAIGYWPALGEQRSQVATAAFFAFSTYTAATTTTDRAGQLGQIVLLVLIGCGLGLIVNLCIAPPLRYRGAEQGLQALGREVETLLDDMADGLREGEVTAERTQEWIAAGERAQNSVTVARSGLSDAEDSLPLNPRRLLPAHRGYLTFSRYRQVLVSMERSVHQLVSLNRSLDQWQEAENTYAYKPFLNDYADFLAALRDTAHVLAALDTDVLPDQAEEAFLLAGTAQEKLQAVLQEAQEAGLPLADRSRPYGVLVVEATRLMEEFQFTCDALRSTASS